MTSCITHLTPIIINIVDTNTDKNPIRGETTAETVSVYIHEVNSYMYSSVPHIYMHMHVCLHNILGSAVIVVLTRSLTR